MARGNRGNRASSPVVQRSISGRNANAARLREEAEQARRVREAQEAAARQERVSQVQSVRDVGQVMALTSGDQDIPFDDSYEFKPEPRDSLGHIPLTSDDQLFKRNLMQGSSGANTYSAEDAVQDTEQPSQSSEPSIDELMKLYGGDSGEYNADEYTNEQGVQDDLPPMPDDTPISNYQAGGQGESNISGRGQDGQGQGGQMIAGNQVAGGNFGGEGDKGSGGSGGQSGEQGQPAAGQSLSEAGIREAQEELGRQVAAEQAPGGNQQQELLKSVEQLLDPSTPIQDLQISQDKDGGYDITQKSRISAATPAPKPAAVIKPTATGVQGTTNQPTVATKEQATKFIDEQKAARDSGQITPQQFQTNITDGFENLSVEGHDATQDSMKFAKEDYEKNTGKQLTQEGVVEELISQTPKEAIPLVNESLDKLDDVIDAMPTTDPGALPNVGSSEQDPKVMAQVSEKLGGFFDSLGGLFKDAFGEKFAGMFLRYAVLYAAARVVGDERGAANFLGGVVEGDLQGMRDVDAVALENQRADVEYNRVRKDTLEDQASDRQFQSEQPQSKIGKRIYDIQAGIKNGTIPAADGENAIRQLTANLSTGDQSIIKGSHAVDVGTGANYYANENGAGGWSYVDQQGNPSSRGSKSC